MPTKPTVRDMMVARLTQNFGEPMLIDQDFRWTIPTDPHGAHPPVNIAIDCWKTPENVRVWVFDPRRTNLQRAQYFTVDDPAQVEVALAKVRACIDAVS